MFERGTLEIWKACMLDTGKSIPVCGLLSHYSIPLLHQHPTIRAAPHSATSTLMEASLTGEAIQEYPTHTSLIMEVSIGSECNSIGVGKVSLPSVRMIMARCCTKPSKDPTHHPSLLSCRHTRPSSENTQLFLIINTASAVPRIVQPRDKF